MLSFTKAIFIKHELKRALPSRITSVQTPNGSIFVIGGILEDKSSSGAITALNNCLEIDQNLKLHDKPKMHTARFDTPVTLVHEKFILVFGGKTNSKHGSKRCELYDTKAEQWHHLAPMPFFCVNTSAAVVKKRHVYLLPGQNRDTLVNKSLLIGYLDTAPLERGLEGLPSLQWAKLVVRNNSDFISAGPVAGIPMKSDPYKLLMFGG